MAKSSSKKEKFSYIRVIQQVCNSRPLTLSRKDFWLFYLITTVLITGLFALFMALEWAAIQLLHQRNASDGTLNAITFLIQALFVIVYVVSAVFRYIAMAGRFHDAGKSALWLLWLLAPYGSLVLLVAAAVLPHRDSKYSHKTKIPTKSPQRKPRSSAPSKKISYTSPTIAQRIDNITGEMVAEIMDTPGSLGEEEMDEPMQKFVVWGLGTMLIQYAIGLMSEKLEHQHADDPGAVTVGQAIIASNFSSVVNTPSRDIFNGIGKAKAEQIKKDLLELYGGAEKYLRKVERLLAQVDYE